MDPCATVEEHGNELAKSPHNDGIGNDLWYEILSKFPLKPLMRFKCVSKSWHHLASKIIINQSIPKYPICGFFITNDERTFHYLPLKRDDEDYEEKKSSSANDYDSMCISSPPPPLVVNIFDTRGQFLYSFEPQKDCHSFIYNPITRKWVSDNNDDYDEEKRSCDGDDDDDDGNKKSRSFTNHYDSLTSLPSHPETHIVDSRDGFLLCSSNYLQKDYFLYNPVTRQCVSLPKPPIPTIGTAVHAITKLVFDESTGFYRVIRLAIGLGNIDEDDWDVRDAVFDCPHMSVDFYSSETGKWVVSKELELPRYFFRPKSLFFDGGIYLLVKDLKGVSKIFRFDVNDESFRFVWSPPGSVLNSSDCLGVCEGRLRYAQHLDRREDCRVEVWEFNDEKEWVLKYNTEDFLKSRRFSVVNFHPYLTALFVRRAKGFHWYDLATGMLERTMPCSPPIRNTESYYMRFKVYPFSECYIHRRL